MVCYGVEVSVPVHGVGLSIPGHRVGIHGVLLLLSVLDEGAWSGRNGWAGP
jgi:hypothetical protein